jgi:hypothetical protein
MRYPSKVIATLAATALSLAVAAAPAGAALYSQDRFDFTFAETFDECGITIDHTAVGHGGFSIRTIKGTDEAYLGWQNLSAVDTFTNRANGRWFTIGNRSTFRETKGTHVEGNIWTFDSKPSGASFTVRDAAGRVVTRDSGTLRMATTYDLLGDGQPGAEQIGDPVVTAMNGRFTEVDFCADLVGPLLGRSPARR